MKKQYIVLDENQIPEVTMMTLTNIEGIFIECPHCEKLIRIKQQPLVQQSAESTTGEKGK